MGEQISSRSTFVTKWVVPLAWLGGVGYFIVDALQNAALAEDWPMAVGVPVLMLAAGFLFFKALVWDLADRVYDQGTHLLVRRHGAEERVALDNIMNVSSTPMMNPPRVTLRLVKPGVFGAYVSFLPKSSIFSFAFLGKNDVAEQLMERAYAARTRAGRRA